MNINKIIPITVRISPAGLDKSNFGKLLLLSRPDDLLPDSGLSINDYMTFGGIDEVATKFDTGSETYRAASAWFSVIPKPKDIVIGIRDADNDSLVDSLTKMRKKLWFYWVAFTKEAYADSAAIKSCGVWGDTNGCFIINCQANPDIKDATNTGDIASELNTQGSRHIFTEFNDQTGDLDAYAGISTAALFARINFNAADSTITAEYKVKPGTSSMNLDADQEQALEAKNVVFYTDITAGESTDRGNVKNSKTHSAYGEWIDDVFNLDAFINFLQVDLYNVVRSQPAKLKGTPRGQRQLIARAERVCETFIDNGYLGPREYLDPDDGLTKITRGYEILTKPTDILSITESERNKRGSAPIRVRIFKAGAIHIADVTVDVY
ncbi:tail sheath protein [Vibrio phage vB_VpM-pA2SJ1]|uniref:Tail sheath protein n=1 Tax=Vibrio phage vB_VpM-pA2SJ1 TaxID=3095964 RepID=A0AAX4J5D5_9CAUD